MRQLVVPTLLVGLCIGPSALAATLEAVKGQVAINRGEGFRRVEGTIQAGAGDLVMASQGGSANLIYPDGCFIKVKPGSVIRVGVNSPCKATYALDGQENSGFVSQLGPFAIGGAAVFTAFAFSAFADDEGGGNRPASP